MKKVLVAFLMTTLLASTASALAAPLAPENQPSSTLESARAERTEWKYRIVNGVTQKRLWSITYGVWKTEWVNC